MGMDQANGLSPRNTYTNMWHSDDKGKVLLNSDMSLCCLKANVFIVSSVGDVNYIWHMIIMITTTQISLAH